MNLTTYHYVALGNRGTPMQWIVEYLEDDDYFHVVNKGVYNVGDCVNLYQSIFENKFWKPGSSILFDQRRVQYRDVNYPIMSKLSFDLSGYEPQIGESRIGYVVETRAAYGICRQFQMLMETKIPMTIGIFMDKERAVEWVTGKNVK